MDNNKTMDSHNLKCKGSTEILNKDRIITIMVKLVELLKRTIKMLLLDNSTIITMDK